MPDRALHDPALHDRPLHDRLVPDLAAARARVDALFDAPPALPLDDLAEVAVRILDRKDALLAAIEGHPTPLYLYDAPGFRAALATFQAAFATLPGHRAHYAVKANPHPWVVGEAVAAGYGLDVSSGRELALALSFPGDFPILFSGPAKSAADLAAAVAHADRVLVHVDSWRELARLGEAAAAAGREVRAGIRVSTSVQGAWAKFGVPLADLPAIWRAAPPLVRLEGVQLHLSWNRDAEPYVRMLRELADVLATLTAAERATIRFVDIGGGFRPHRVEGYFPGDLPLGAAIRAGDEAAGVETAFVPPYLVKPSIPVEAYAEAIRAAVDTCLRPLVDVAIWSEPGRIVATYAMHLLLTVVDRKRDDLVIVDGGINMVGWERYLHVYCPVVNLTHPAATEIEVVLGGSLCDCEDLWGHRVYASAVLEGDLLVVPYQGAYTWSTAQEFIRPIPDVVRLGA